MDLFTLAFITLFIAGGFLIGAILIHNRKHVCTRCTKRLSADEIVDFCGWDMCESCENVASYYNQMQ